MSLTLIEIGHYGWILSAYASHGKFEKRGKKSAVKKLERGKRGNKPGGINPAKMPAALTDTKPVVECLVHKTNAE